MNDLINNTNNLEPPKKNNILKAEYGEFLSPKFSFNSFIVGKSNQFAHASALATAKKPGIYNPLFIVGKTGLGKTHLLKAIGYQMINEIVPQPRVCYRPTQKFIEEVIQAIRTDSRHELHERYSKSCDLLLMDDIQFLSRAASTQDEFFRIFNALFDSGKQIVITSDRFPKEMADVHDRIISRFECGMIADIDSPELETRVAILKNRAEAEKVKISDEVCYLIATHVKANIRELEGCLTKLAAHAAIYNVQIDSLLVKKVLKSHIQEVSKVISLDEIVAVVSQFYSLKGSDIRGPSRKAPIAKARQVVMFLGRDLARLSCSAVGEQLGNRHHTTVIHGYDYVNKKLKVDPTIKSHIKQIEAQLLR